MKKNILLYKLHKYQQKLELNPSNTVYQKKIYQYSEIIGGNKKGSANITPKQILKKKFIKKKLLGNISANLIEKLKGFHKSNIDLDQSIKINLIDLVNDNMKLEHEKKIKDKTHLCKIYVYHRYIVLAVYNNNIINLFNNIINLYVFYLDQDSNRIGIINLNYDSVYNDCGDNGITINNPFKISNISIKEKDIMLKLKYNKKIVEKSLKDIMMTFILPNCVLNLSNSELDVLEV